MPIYYHIQREPNNTLKKFIKDNPLFFSKKNSFYYKTYKSSFKESVIYKIYIPLSRFTNSFNPKIK